MDSGNIPPAPPPPGHPLSASGVAPAVEESSGDPKVVDGIKSIPEGSAQVRPEKPRTVTAAPSKEILNTGSIEKKCREKQEELRVISAQIKFVESVPSLISELKIPSNNPAFAIRYQDGDKSISVIPPDESLKADDEKYKVIKEKLLAKLKEVEAKYNSGTELGSEEKKPHTHLDALKQTAFDYQASVDSYKSQLEAAGIAPPAVFGKPIEFTLDLLLKATLNEPVKPAQPKKVATGDFVLKPRMPLVGESTFKPNEKQPLPDDVISDIKSFDRDKLRHVPQPDERPDEEARKD